MGTGASVSLAEAIQGASQEELVAKLSALTPDGRARIQKALGEVQGTCGSVPSYKLVYFDIRGLAEPARMLFAIAKQPYEDCRFSISFGVPGDFSTIKRPEFDAAKAAGELDVSLGKVPYLEVDGVKVGQSKAIERFLARQFGFIGSTSVEAAQVEQLVETVADIKDAYQKVKGITDADEKAKGMEKWFVEDLPASCALAEKLLPAGPGPWLIGSKFSYADLAWYTFLEAPKGFFDNTEGAHAAFQGCPKLKAAMEATGAIPELQEWIAKRPDTMF